MEYSKRKEKIIRYLTGKFTFGGVFPNDGYFAGVPKNIFAGVGLGNVGTGLDTLFSFNFPAISFKQDGANARIKLAGGFGTNDDNKRLALGFDAATIFDTTLIDIDGNGFLIYVYILRVDATHVNLEATMIIGNVNIDSAGAIASGGAKVASINNNNLAVNNMDTGGGSAILLTGESATATNNNVFCDQALIDLVRF